MSNQYNKKGKFWKAKWKLLVHDHDLVKVSKCFLVVMACHIVTPHISTLYFSIQGTKGVNNTSIAMARVNI